MDDTLQLKASIEASTIKSGEFIGVKPVFFPVWTVPFSLTAEDLDPELLERRITVASGVTLDILEDQQLLHQGFTGAMVSSNLMSFSYSSV